MVRDDGGREGRHRHLRGDAGRPDGGLVQRHGDGAVRHQLVGTNVATAGTDYVASTGTLTFAAGESVKTVTVDITDDATAEGF